MEADRERGQEQAPPTDAHQHLRTLLEDASRCLARRDLSPGEVRDIFDRLQTELLDHFRHEEEFGYFDEAIDVAPRLKARADDLLEQHPKLEARLKRLRSMAAHDRVTDQWWHAVTEEFASFYDAFDQHERAETALLQEAYLRDVGTDD